MFREGHEVREVGRRATPAREAAASPPPPIFPKEKVGSVRVTKKLAPRSEFFSFVSAGHNIVRTQCVIISSEARTSLPRSGTNERGHSVASNDVAPEAQMKLPSANDVCLRPMMLRVAQAELKRSPVL